MYDLLSKCLGLCFHRFARRRIIRAFPAQERDLALQSVHLRSTRFRLVPILQRTFCEVVWRPEAPPSEDDHTPLCGRARRDAAPPRTQPLSLTEKPPMRLEALERLPGPRREGTALAPGGFYQGEGSFALD